MTPPWLRFPAGRGWTSMRDYLGLLLLAPILRGFLAMLAAGSTFPICGVMVLRLDLVPIRYMLMHGMILGGAISLALSLPLVPVTALVNIALVLLMMSFGKNQRSYSGAGAATMVLSMAAASVLTHVADVPAKDTLSLLWGSPFALQRGDLVTLALLGILLVAYVTLHLRTILAIFFSRDVARSLGIKVRQEETFLVLVIALVVALAMKILGAFLIDALLLLPVLSASKTSRRGMKQLFLTSCLFGFLAALGGYLLAVAIDWPPSATIAIASGILYLEQSLFQKRRIHT